jgi:hypothetical protein
MAINNRPMVVGADQARRGPGGLMAVGKAAGRLIRIVKEAMTVYFGGLGFVGDEE